MNIFYSRPGRTPNIIKTFIIALASTSPDPPNNSAMLKATRSKRGFVGKVKSLPAAFSTSISFLA